MKNISMMIWFFCALATSGLIPNVVLADSCELTEVTIGLMGIGCSYWGSTSPCDVDEPYCEWYAPKDCPLCKVQVCYAATGSYPYERTKWVCKPLTNSTGNLPCGSVSVKTEVFKVAAGTFASDAAQCTELWMNCPPCPAGVKDDFEDWLADHIDDFNNSGAGSLNTYEFGCDCSTSPPTCSKTCISSSEVVW